MDEGGWDPRWSYHKIQTIILELAMQDDPCDDAQWHEAWGIWFDSEDGVKFQKCVNYLARVHQVSANDLLQDSLLKLIDLVFCKKYDPNHATLGTFASGIARTIAKKAVDRKKKDTVIVEEPLEEIGNIPASPNRPDTSRDLNSSFNTMRDVEEKIVKQEKSQLLQLLMGSLSREDQFILEMSADGMNSGKIAAALGVSSETVRKRLERLRKKLAPRGLQLVS